MQVIWVLENIRGDKSFYNELDSLLLFASVVQMRKHHSSTIQDYILYCDPLTHDHIRLHDKEDLWTEIRTLPRNKFIDKSTFWASSKLEVLRNVNKPTLVLDHDFIIYREIKEVYGETLIVAHEEEGKNYYPTRYDPFIREVQDLIPFPGDKAINCCFNFFPDPLVANAYAKLSLEVMERFTKLKVPSSKFLIFAEQLVLKYFLDFNNIKYTSLLQGTWLAREQEWEERRNGVIPLDEMNLTFRHYWMDKPKIKESKDGFEYQEEIRILRRIVDNARSSVHI